jgi:hypothetical protein
LLGLRRVERLLAEGRSIAAPGGDIAAEHGTDTSHASRRWSSFVPPAKERIAGVNSRAVGAQFIVSTSVTHRKEDQHGRISQAIE